MTYTVKSCKEGLGLTRSGLKIETELHWTEQFGKQNQVILQQTSLYSDTFQYNVMNRYRVFLSWLNPNLSSIATLYTQMTLSGFEMLEKSHTLIVEPLNV